MRIVISIGDIIWLAIGGIAIISIVVIHIASRISDSMNKKMQKEEKEGVE